LEYHEKSLDIARRIGDVKLEGVTLNNMGLVYVSLGQYPKGLESLEKSLEISKRIGDAKTQGDVLNNIAAVRGRI